MLRRCLLILPLLAYIGVAHAGPYTDDLTKCVVASSTQQDKVALVRWVFSAMALHPQVAPLTKISASEREDIERKMAALVERLLTETCRQQTVDAVNYEGSHAIEQSFNLLGQIASRELMSSPETAAGVAAYWKYVDKKKFEALGK